MCGIYPPWLFLYDIFFPLNTVRKRHRNSKTSKFNLLESAGRVLGNNCGLRGGVVISSVGHLALVLLLLVEAVDLVVMALVGRAHVVVALALRTVFSLVLSIRTV